MPRLRITLAALLAGVLVLTACSGDDDGDGNSPGDGAPTGKTELTVSGEATRAESDPAAPVGDPFSFSIDCGNSPDGSDEATVTVHRGPQIDDPGEICAELARDPDRFAAVGPDPDRICTEIYGGPQTAHIEGTVDGQPVDVDIARNDGCGIDDWDSLEFLLGPPSR